MPDHYPRYNDKVQMPPQHGRQQPSTCALGDVLHTNDNVTLSAVAEAAHTKRRGTAGITKRLSGRQHMHGVPSVRCSTNSQQHNTQDILPFQQLSVEPICSVSDLHSLCVLSDLNSPYNGALWPLVISQPHTIPHWPSVNVHQALRIPFPSDPPPPPPTPTAHPPLKASRS